MDPTGSDTIELRRARLTDAIELLPLTDQLGYPVEPQVLRGRLEQLVNDPKHFILIAGSDGSAIGWIHVEYRLSLEAGEKCEIIGLVVDDMERRKGIGSRLVAAAIEWASSLKLPLVVRSNIKRGEAHGFYEALGFDRQKSQHVYALRPDRCA